MKKYFVLMLGLIMFMGADLSTAHAGRLIVRYDHDLSGEVIVREDPRLILVSSRPVLPRGCFIKVIRSSPYTNIRYDGRDREVIICPEPVRHRRHHHHHHDKNCHHDRGYDY